MSNQKGQAIHFKSAKSFEKLYQEDNKQNLKEEKFKNKFQQKVCNFEKFLNKKLKTLGQDQSFSPNCPPTNRMQVNVSSAKPLPHTIKSPPISIKSAPIKPLNPKPLIIHPVSLSNPPYSPSFTSRSMLSSQNLSDPSPKKTQFLSLSPIYASSIDETLDDVCSFDDNSVCNERSLSSALSNVENNDALCVNQQQQHQPQQKNQQQQPQPQQNFQPPQDAQTNSRSIYLQPSQLDQIQQSITQEQEEDREEIFQQPKHPLKQHNTYEQQQSQQQKQHPYQQKQQPSQHSQPHSTSQFHRSPYQRSQSQHSGALQHIDRVAKPNKTAQKPQQSYPRPTKHQPFPRNSLPTQSLTPVPQLYRNVHKIMLNSHRDPEGGVQNNKLRVIQKTNLQQPIRQQKNQLINQLHPSQTNHPTQPLRPHYKDPHGPNNGASIDSHQQTKHFPNNPVKGDSPQKNDWLVLEDFESSFPAEITVKKNQKVRVLRKLYGEWVEVMCGRDGGIIPAKCISLMF